MDQRQSSRARRWCLHVAVLSRFAATLASVCGGGGPGGNAMRRRFSSRLRAPLCDQRHHVRQYILFSIELPFVIYASRRDHPSPRQQACPKSIQVMPFDIPIPPYRSDTLAKPCI